MILRQGALSQYASKPAPCQAIPALVLGSAIALWRRGLLRLRLAVLGFTLYFRCPSGDWRCAAGDAASRVSTVKPGPV